MPIRFCFRVLAAVQMGTSFELFDTTRVWAVSSEMTHTDRANTCEGCTMPMASQMGRLVVANTLRPPYGALEVPLGEIFDVTTEWNLHFHHDYNEEAAILEALLGSSSQRLFFRRVLKRIGAIGSTELLSDCCWKIVEHDCFTSSVKGGNCSRADADHLLTAKRTSGECAIIFQQGNDEEEFGTLKDPAKYFQDIVPFRLRVSERDVATWRMAGDDYALATNLAMYHDFIASASSGECSKVYASGFSFGSVLGQLFRADYGKPNVDGVLTKACTFGNRTVDCSLYGFGVLYAFYNSTVEVERDAENLFFTMEDDLVAEIPEVFRSGVFCPSCPTDIRSPAFRGVLPYSRLRGAAMYQLRRDLGITFSPMRFRVRTEAVGLPRGVSTIEWQRNRSYIDRNESYTYGLLGTLSHPDCFDIQKAVFGDIRRSTSCGHFCRECYFLTDTAFDEVDSDIRIPMPASTSLYDIYRVTKLPEAVFTEVMNDLVMKGDN